MYKRVLVNHFIKIPYRKITKSYCKLGKECKFLIPNVIITVAFNKTKLFVCNPTVSN